MIFDSPKMIELREKYRDLPNYEVPEVVFLDRHEGYSGERLLLESLFTRVSPEKQKDWLGRFVNDLPEQHIGVWFEIMLYGWLIEHFSVTVEPEILGNFPDFVLNVPGCQLAIEAKAFLKPPEEREKKRKFNRIWSALSSIQKPFSVNLKIKKLGKPIVVAEFVKIVSLWLDTKPEDGFAYDDAIGNSLNLTATLRTSLKKVGVVSSEGFWVNPDILKTPLSKKAEQHKALRKAGFPYVIAIFLEPSHLSAEEVSEAWLGRTTIVYDPDTEKVVEEKVDQSGIHYFGREIRHKSVTGTLVFKIGYDNTKNSRYLQSWYVQNPYANVEIDPKIFPIESKFIVIGHDDEMFEMKWVR
jgi:hypothetical protein